MTYYTCISSVASTILLFALLFLMRKKCCFSNALEPRVFVFLYAISMLRLFFPLDFEITKGISCEGVYSWLFNLLFIKKIKFFTIEISIINILVGIFVIVSVLQILQYIKMYYKVMRETEEYEGYEIKQQSRVIEEIKKIYPNLPECMIKKSREVRIPFTFGIFRKKIVLPDVNYSDTELYYILLHECTHLVKGDLIKKYAIDIWGRFFWWLPFHKFICRDMEQLIEIQCDSSVVKKISHQNKYAYMSTLLNAVRYCSEMESEGNSSSLAFFHSENMHTMIERFHILGNGNGKKKTNYVFLFIGILLMAASYLFVPVSAFEPDIKEIENSGYTSVSPENPNQYLYYENGNYFLVTDTENKISIPPEHVQHMLESGIEIKK